MSQEQRKTVMISSTARDLPEPREQAMDACLRQGMFPVMMEHLPASPEDAIRGMNFMSSRVDAFRARPGSGEVLLLSAGAWLDHVVARNASPRL
jgi:hypothetical protein